MANLMLAGDKNPGVRPMGCGESFCRYVAKLVIRAAGKKAALACGNKQLCSGLDSGIEGTVHGMRTFLPKKDFLDFADDGTASTTNNHNV